MNTFVCGKCGYIAFGEAPESCPVCGAKKQAFELDPTAIKKPADPNNLNELEKKHIPVIEIKKQCGLVGPGCVDANIKIGQILHPAEENHHIMYIDLYLDYNFIARYHLTAALNPVLGIHLKGTSSKLVALENCNLHGRWTAEAQI
jgi:superoxide reductase